MSAPRLEDKVALIHAVVYLACDESIYVTGSELVVDRGTTALSLDHNARA